MTWRHFLRTMAVVVPGAIALAFAPHARAEGGEGSSLVSPQEIESAQAVAPAEQAEAPAEETAETSASRKGAKPPVRSAAADAAEEAESPAADAGRATGRAASRIADAARAGALKPLIARYAAENALPFELADAVVRLESRYNARARNGGNLGLTQVNLRTAQSLGYKGDAAGLFDAETNLQYGLKYLAKAYSLAGGDTCGTILRYQFGHRTQAMTAASRVYCAKVKTIIAAAE